ncbi:MAG: T9SS C-terminal target domain-containing protein [Calditrichaeota bacterium]|nr:MAG: T9SS C-terminal target domain-containing protein [Calditrichota bacterium]
MKKTFLTFSIFLLSLEPSFAQLTASFPDSSFTFFSESQITETTIPVWISNADTSHQAISFDFNFYYKLGDLRVKNVSMIPSGSFEFSVNPDGQNENEVVSAAGVLNSELVGNIHLLDVTFEIPTNLHSGFERKIDWVNFRFTPKQPQIILEDGVLTLAKNGDFDKSNELDSTDAILLLDKLTSNGQFSGYHNFVSDFDRNGKIQAFDCAKILEFAQSGVFTPEIFSFTVSDFEGETFATTFTPYSFKINLNNSVSLNAVSAKVQIPNSDFVLDSVKISNDFSGFINSISSTIENEFWEINLGLASSNKIVNGNLTLCEIFLTPIQSKSSTEITLSNLVTNIEPEQAKKNYQIEILENSLNDTLKLFFAETKFIEMGEEVKLSIFTPRISSFWQVEDVNFEIHFPISKMKLESFSSNYFEDISKRTFEDFIQFVTHETNPKDFSGNLMEFTFSPISENLIPKDSVIFQVREFRILSEDPNTEFPHIFLENNSLLIPYKLGDFNGDNISNQTDFQSSLTKLSLFEKFDDFETKTIDFDNSEDITSFDLSLLLKFLNNQDTNLSKSFEGSHNFIFPDSTLKFKSFLLKLNLTEARNIFGGRGKISWKESDFRLLNSNFSNSDTSLGFAWNNFGFCFASQNPIQNEVFELELLPLKEGDLEISIKDLEINGISQNSQNLTIFVKENSETSELIFSLPYPNPNLNGVLKVDIFEDFDSVNFEIFNILGQRVLKGEQIPNSSKIEIPLLNSKNKRLANGVYFLNLKGNSLTNSKERNRSFTILK